MSIYEMFKKQVFVTSRIIKADPREDALGKFEVVSSNIDSVVEDDKPVEEVDVVERYDCDEGDVDY